MNLTAYRLAKKNNLDADTYYTLMIDNINEVTDKRLEVLEEIEKHKREVARGYNKKVKIKSFQDDDLVWRTILPIGTKSIKFGNWSSSWEGPYRVVSVCFRNSYMVDTLQGFLVANNTQWKVFERSYPSVGKVLESRYVDIALEKNGR